MTTDSSGLSYLLLIFVRSPILVICAWVLLSFRVHFYKSWRPKQWNEYEMILIPLHVTHMWMLGYTNWQKLETWLRLVTDIYHKGSLIKIKTTWLTLTDFCVILVIYKNFWSSISIPSVRSHFPTCKMASGMRSQF